MGLQVIAQAESAEVVSSCLQSVAESSEIFHIEGALWGVSIPTKVLDDVGEEEVRRLLSKLDVYELYEGVWRRK